MGCQGNHAFSQNENIFIFKDNFVLHLGCPKEQFGDGENFSGAKGKLYWMSGYERVFGFCKIQWVG